MRPGCAPSASPRCTTRGTCGSNGWCCWSRWYCTSRRRRSCPVATGGHGRSAMRTGNVHKRRSLRGQCVTGGVILALFIVWHLLDLSLGVVNPDFDANSPVPQRRQGLPGLVDQPDLHRGCGAARRAYQHGFWSATQTLGVNRPTRARAVKAISLDAGGRHHRWFRARSPSAS